MADFARYADAFREADVDVIAASVDGLDDARELVEETNFPYPTAYGLDTMSVAALLGAFYQPTPEGGYLHPADFIIMPDGRIVSSTYSTAAIGRLEPEDTLKYIARKKAVPPNFT